MLSQLLTLMAHAGTTQSRQYAAPRSGAYVASGQISHFLRLWLFSLMYQPRSHGMQPGVDAGGSSSPPSPCQWPYGHSGGGAGFGGGGGGGSGDNIPGGGGLRGGGLGSALGGGHGDGGGDGFGGGGGGGGDGGGGDGGGK